MFGLQQYNLVSVEHAHLQHKREEQVSPGCCFCIWRGGVNSNQISDKFSRVVVLRDVVPLHGHEPLSQASGASTLSTCLAWIAYERCVYIYVWEAAV